MSGVITTARYLDAVGETRSALVAFLGVGVPETGDDARGLRALFYFRAGFGKALLMRTSIAPPSSA